MNTYDKAAAPTDALEREKLAYERFWRKWKPTAIGFGVFAAASLVISIFVASACDEVHHALIAIGVGLIPYIVFGLWYGVVVETKQHRLQQLEQQAVAAREQSAQDERNRWKLEQEHREVAARAERGAAQADCVHEWAPYEYLDNVRWGDGGMWVQDGYYCPKCGSRSSSTQ
jgi:hypothetical protein